MNIRQGKNIKVFLSVNNNDGTAHSLTSITNLVVKLAHESSGEEYTISSSSITISGNTITFEIPYSTGLYLGKYDLHASWTETSGTGAQARTEPCYLDSETAFTVVNSSQNENVYTEQQAVSPEVVRLISTVTAWNGMSAYEIAVKNGYIGTETQWLASLKGDQGNPGPGVPTGGTTGQILKKHSNTNYDAEWADGMNPSDYYTKSQTDDAINSHHDSTKQDKIDSDHKLPYSLISDQPSVPSKTSDLTNDSGFVDNTYHDASKQDKIDSDHKLPYSNISGTPDLSNFITKSVNDLINYYKKTETYTKNEVNTIVSAIKQFTYEVVSALPTASASTMNKIYLVPSTSSQQGNVKDEYITLDNGESAQTRYTWEQIGSTSIDLSNYVTTQQLNTALANYVTSSSLATTLANYSTTSQMNSAIQAHHDNTKQDKLIAGSGIRIGSDGKTISTTGGSPQWGGITGYLDSQIDLKYRLEEIEETYNSEAQPLVCGQPMIIFAAGAISADNIPFNWIDAEHGGYDWGGQAAFAGQVYVNISGANNNNKYVACPSTRGGYDLNWK